MKKLGFVFIALTLLLNAEKSIEIRENSRHLIHIEGQKVFTTEKLYNVLDVETKSMFVFWKDEKESPPTIDTKLLPTLEATLVSFYQSEGFYDAKFSIDEYKESIDINIKENKPVIVKNITIESDYNITGYILLKKNDIFKATSFVTTKNTIIASLLDAGYCSYDLDAKAYVDLSRHSAKLKYTLKKGDICIFGKPNITGLTSIDKEVIESRVRAIEGTRFDPAKVKETYAGIYALDSFDTVQVNVDRKFYNVVPIDIILSEVVNAYHMEVGAGYDTYIGPRVHASLLKKNFLGDAKKTGIRLSWSAKEQLAVGEYYKPAMFLLWGYGIDFGTEFGYSNLEFRGFQEKKGFAKIYFEHNEGRLKLRTGLSLENIDIALNNNLKKNENLLQAINSGNFALLYPYIDIVYDARDDKLNPKYGYYLSSSMEYGIDYKPNASSYLKFALEGRYIHTFDKLTLAMVSKAGVMDRKFNDLPESKLFFAGGSYSNRAYGFNEMGVILSSRRESIYGASTMLNLSLEADYPVWNNIYGAVFTDNTMLNEKSYDFSGEIITSAGLGVRYLTPIGPFKLDVGFNVNRPSEYGISFQIGQSF